MNETPDDLRVEADAKAGEVWQESDGVLLLCVVPGEWWQDFCGSRVPWDASLIARPLRRLLDAKGSLALAAADAVGDRAASTISVADIDRQRELGWPDFHPEDYCHRCGHKNISWFAPADAWNPVMRPNGPDSPWLWNEIICPSCFGELFSAKYPLTSFDLSPAEDTRGGRAWRAEYPAVDDRAVLVAEVERHEREMGNLIDERDRMHEMADRLAHSIAPMEVIGEHSSGNDPWSNALDVRDELTAQRDAAVKERDDLRARIEALAKKWPCDCPGGGSEVNGMHDPHCSSNYADDLRALSSDESTEAPVTRRCTCADPHPSDTSHSMSCELWPRPKTVTRHDDEVAVKCRCGFPGNPNMPCHTPSCPVTLARTATRSGEATTGGSTEGGKS